MLHGPEDLGTVGDELLVAETDGPRVLLLAGQDWQVTNIDWTRRRCWVEPSDIEGRARWGLGYGGLSFDVTRGMRAVLLGTDPPGVHVTHRAQRVLGSLRETHSRHVDVSGTIFGEGADAVLHWWNWAGSAVNRTLQASLPGVVDPRQRINDRSLRLLPDLSREQVTEAFIVAKPRRPTVNEAAVSGLKFSSALPTALAVDTLAARLGDIGHARKVLGEPHSFVLD